MRAHLAAILAATVCLGLSASSAARATDQCPAALTGRGAYVLERGGSSKTEVTFGDDAMIGAVTRVQDRALLELREYQGLIQLERIDRSHRTMFKPESDLAKLFPLRPRQQIEIWLEASEEGVPPTVVAISLRMVGVDNLAIGGCNYDVLKFERTESRSGRTSEAVTDYYAPELRFVIAKEYRERDGRSTLIKYDRIYSVTR
jgi:hypothetical protein